MRRTDLISCLTASTLGLMLGHDAGTFLRSGSGKPGDIVIGGFRGLQHRGHGASPTRRIEGGSQRCDVQDSAHIDIAHADKVTREEGQ